MSSVPPLLSAAAVTGGGQWRSASKAVVKAASGFHVFRIEGYSLAAKVIPGGEKISSPDFAVGGRRWRVDVYPNGADDSHRHELQSGAMALFLVYRGEKAGDDYRGRVDGGELHQPLRRVAAEFRFSLLDRAGNAAYELPAEKSVFRRSRSGGGGRRRGHDAFISNDELERRRRERLILHDDCLAVRCDVGVIDQLWVQSIAVGDDGAKRRRRRDDANAGAGSSCSSYDTNTESSSSSSSADDYSCSEADSGNDSPSRRRNKRRRRRREIHRLMALRSFES